MEIWSPTDDELIKYLALHGAKGLYETAFYNGKQFAIAEMEIKSSDDRIP